MSYAADISRTDWLSAFLPRRKLGLYYELFSPIRKILLVHHRIERQTEAERRARDIQRYLNRVTGLYVMVCASKLAVVIACVTGRK